jgi:hypothetical protein
LLKEALTISRKEGSLAPTCKQKPSVHFKKSGKIKYRLKIVLRANKNISCIASVRLCAEWKLSYSILHQSCDEAIVGISFHKCKT